MEENKSLQTTTKPASLTIFRPEVLSRDLVRVRTAKDALALAGNDNFPSIAELRRDFGAEKIESVIKLYLIDLCENVNLKRPLKEIQIDNIAREIVSAYYALTMADLHVVFRKAKTGEYGEFYESLDMPKVISWFRVYFNKRCELAAEESINHSRYDKGGNLTSEWMARIFDKMEKSIKAK